MAMMTGGRGPVAQINVTPMIDVLLVLLIIFMVIQPSLSQGLQAEIPRESAAAAPTPIENTAIIVSVLADGSLRINKTTVEAAALAGQLRRVFAGRPNGAVFVQASPELAFERVALVVDAARAAGIGRVALMPGKR